MVDTKIRRKWSTLPRWLLTPPKTNHPPSQTRSSRARCGRSESSGAVKTPPVCWWWVSTTLGRLACPHSPESRFFPAQSKCLPAHPWATPRTPLHNPQCTSWTWCRRFNWTSRQHCLAEKGSGSDHPKHPNTQANNFPSPQTASRLLWYSQNLQVRTP